jgi:DNA-directed RNA polymerase subunit RPC12/RpoP
MATKKELLEQEVAKAVGAGKVAALETVNFNDENRPPTCLEVDFPILPINQVAVIEGNAGKPIYQMSKWWARRRSSVFRSMLIAAATKAPADKSYAAKLVWDNYYANHQKKGAFKHLKVADIFMGGGTTLVEGSRLGMQMSGNDLNPIAWFVVKQEFAKVDPEEVKRLLADIEAEVKPQIMPFYYCDGPNGQRGEWTHVPTGKVMGKKFDPLTLTPDQRFEYKYEGPEIVYTFWAKHGPCQVMGCGHRTPIITSTVLAVKTLSVKYWERICGKCGTRFHAEEHSARMAPDVTLYLAPSEKPFSVIDPEHGIVCPKCNHTWMAKLGTSKTKKVELTLLVHPQWLAGSPNQDSSGRPFGGSAQDDVESTSRWDHERARKIRLLEVRGELPETVICPETKVSIKTGKRSGTVPKNSHYACAACGTGQDVLETIKATGKTGPMAGYAIQGFDPQTRENGDAYGGRFFQPFDIRLAAQYDAAMREWEARKLSDLLPYWPQSELPFGFMTHMNNGGIPNHGFTHWWTMFNPRQLLVHALLLKAVTTVGEHSWETREFVLGAFQNFLRNQSMFSFWHMTYDKLAPALSNSNFHPKSTVVEVGAFSPVGYGPWTSTIEVLGKAQEWAVNPWEVVSVETLKRTSSALGSQFSSKSVKVMPGDQLLSASVSQGSSTDFHEVPDRSIDLVITDPPFGGLLHYSELSDFFYVWLRLVLRSKYPEAFGPEFTPKALEVVSNRAREPENPDGFYQRLLTQCWLEAKRILKPGGILAFTFHHSEDEPWIAVLESLFDAGFYLEATYPIRSDETHGEGAKPGTFGSQTIEYDIIHVCRKRTEEPTPVSWGRMRREVLADVRQLQGMLENHAKQGLPPADLQVIRRGKALEYFSRHYGKVYVDEGRAISVKEALVGIIQLIDEDADKSKEPPPVNAEPMTRQFLRIFDGKSELARDQLQKFLRGSVTTPDDFEQRGWCSEKSKVFSPVDPLAFAQEWSGKHRRRLTSDMDQALVLIGACFENSGINATDTLKNDNFRPHVALKPVLEWFQNHGGERQTRTAASRAVSIFNAWMASRKAEQIQGSLFEDYEK